MCAAKTNAHAAAIEPRQTLLKYLVRQIPDPLFTCVVVGVPLLGGVAGLIERAFVDFDLRLAITSGWFLLAVSTAFYVWLSATLIARPRLAKYKLWALIVLFSLGGTAAGYAAFRSFRYRYNDLGFYELRSWHRSARQTQAQTVAWEWHLIAVKSSVTALTFQMAASQRCQSTSFYPNIKKSSAHESGVGINACDVSPDGRNSDIWILESFGRPAEVIFRLETSSLSSKEAICPLPTVTTTSQRCPE